MCPLQQFYIFSLQNNQIRAATKVLLIFIQYLSKFSFPLQFS